MLDRSKLSRVTFGAAIGLITAMLVLSVAGSVYLVSASNKLLHTTQAIEALDHLTGSLTDLETAGRGYALTGESDYLGPVAPALARITLARRWAAEHLQGRPHLLEELAVIEDLSERRIAVVERVVEAVRVGQPDVAQGIVESGQGRILHDEIRRRAHTLRVTLEQELDDARGRLRTSVISLIVALLIVGLASYAALLFGRRSLSLVARADAERMETARRHSDIVENSPDMILTARSGRITFINAAGAEMLGASGEEMTGRSLAGIFGPGSPFPRDHLPALEAAPGIAPIAVNTLVGAQGQSVQAGVRAFSAEGDEGIDVTIMARDVSDVERLNAQLQRAQRMESLGKLTGGVAHDFNNLLTVITGCTETMGDILAEREDEKELSDLNRVVAQAAEQGAGLTHHLLAFARRQPLSPQRLDLKRVLNRTAPLLQRTLGEDVALTLHVAENMSDVVIDPALLENALLNLCLNSRHAMADGGHLTLEAEQIELDRDYANWNEDVEPGPYVRLSVTDDGEGMSQAVADRAFEPFFSTRPQGNGSGLGLSMVYGFMKQSGGHAKIYSEPGQGTTVNLYIPCAGLSTPWSEVSPAPAALEGGQESILVVEDDEMVRQHVERQLRGLGYEVEAAATGAEALQLIESRPFDLLFTDVVMPGGMNGRQLSDAALALRPEMRVLFTSGYTENAIVHQGRLDQGVHLLQKPYRRAELAAAVRRGLA